MNKKNLIIAIDGPVGVGKGTLAVRLAKKLGANYLYTGGMYRALTLVCLMKGIDVNDEEKVFNLLQNLDIDIIPTKSETRVFVDGEEITDEIFSFEVNANVSTVSTHARVRKEMVARQKKMAEEKDIVIEGRDSATDVVPHADLKIYLTADINVRAQRRLKQLQKRGVDVPIEHVLEEIEKRDARDMSREASPLKIVPDAYVIDTTNLSIEETVEKVISKLHEKGFA